MADHGSTGTPSHGYDAHKATYDGFIKGSVALGLLCAFTLVALVAFRFMTTGNVLAGFGGLIIGILAVLIDARTSGKWYISAGWLVVFGLIVAAAIS